MTPSLGSINLLKNLRELKEILTFTSLLKNMIKDTDGYPGGGAIEVEGWGDLSTGTSVPGELRYVTLPGLMYLPT